MRRASMRIGCSLRANPHYYLRVIDLLVRFPNVYADSSGVRRFDYLQQAIERGGAHKVLFGSDGPWLHPALELYKIKSYSSRLYRY